MSVFMPEVVDEVLFELFLHVVVVKVVGQFSTHHLHLPGLAAGLTQGLVTLAVFKLTRKQVGVGFLAVGLVVDKVDFLELVTICCLLTLSWVQMRINF